MPPLVAQSPLVHPTDELAAFNRRRSTDPEEQEKLFADILCAVAEELGSKANFIGPILPRDARKLIKALNDDELKDLQEGVKACLDWYDWAGLASHPILRKPSITGYTSDPEWILAVESSKQATIKSWSHPYQGDTANLFYRYMMRHRPSTRLLHLVQSSGMGKSRLIDEFSKKYFVVPFNLREGNHGYPAPDTAVYNWLTLRGYSSRENDNRFSAFIAALFEEVYKVINDPKAGIIGRIRGCAELSDADKAAALRDYPDSLSGQFRLFMTVGQKFGRQGPLRIKFYDSVLREANELYEGVDLSETPPQQKPPGKFKRKSEGVVELQTVIQRVWEIVGNSASSSSPIMVLAFDEAHTLFSSQETPFTSLRRALRGTRQHPIWNVFLSTTGKSSQFVPPPPPCLHHSGRILWGVLLDATPFTLVGFDQVAEKFQQDMTLASVIEPSFRYSLGRPLWLTRYKNGCPLVRDKMVDFAIQKLLCGWQDSKIFGFTTLEFAIMSRRVALDFDTTFCNSQEKQEAEENQMTQVEKHMRVCLRVRDDLDSVVTVASSEPILSEAAAIVMQRPGFQSCQSLRNILQWPGMGKGDRGELITCNISINTLDSIMFENRQLKSLSVEVTSYFQALFASDIYTKKIQSMLPSRLADEGRRHTFAATFANSRIYVTHFIKAYDCKELSVEFLAKCTTRGVAIVCADNRHAVNIVIPIVIDKDKPLTKENVTALLMQSKNDVRHSTDLFSPIFHALDPYVLGVFNEWTEDPPPVIRMVYALASRKSGVYVVEPPQRNPPKAARKKKYAYTSFDIWCAQASSSTFRAIQTHENEIYEELLKLSRDVPKMVTDSRSIWMNRWCQMKIKIWWRMKRQTTRRRMKRRTKRMKRRMKSKGNVESVSPLGLHKPQHSIHGNRVGPTLSSAYFVGLFSSLTCGYYRKEIEGIKRKDGITKKNHLGIRLNAFGCATEIFKRDRAYSNDRLYKILRYSRNGFTSPRGSPLARPLRPHSDEWVPEVAGIHSQRNRPIQDRTGFAPLV